MPTHDYPDTPALSKMDDPAFATAQSLKAVREAARQRFEAKVAAAYAKLDEQDCIDRLEERLLGQMDDVTKSILGINDKWSRIEIEDGSLRKALEPIVEKLVNEKIAPLFEAQVARLLETKTINAALNKAVKNRVESVIYSLEHHRTDATNRFDKLLEAEVSRIIDEYSI